MPKLKQRNSQDFIRGGASGGVYNIHQNLKSYDCGCKRKPLKLTYKKDVKPY